ncbi:MAG: helix-turn-helix transcriptional regulator [Clostridia bacterium]|nr:helix-turn-helix transcriptional regulator [Clostridia bacterium]
MEAFPFQYRVTKKESGHREMPMSFDELKFVHVLSGTCCWNINGEIFSVEKDDVLIFSRKDQRYIQEVTSSEPLVMEQVIFLPITVYPAEECVALFFETEKCSLLPKNHEYHTKILEDFASIRTEMSEDLPWKNEWIANRITSMAITAARLLGLERKNSSVTGRAQYRTVCEALAYLHENLGEDLSRERVAAALYISPSHLSRIFKEYTGVTLQEYIVRCRVERAVALIRNGKRPIDAAFESGFGSTSGFYRAFSAVTGKKPKDF